MENQSVPFKNPFVGLRPYKPEEKSIFFGRERQVNDLLQLLQTNRIIAMSGPSGSGKTSLINAGLVPELLLGKNGLAGKDWVISVFRPGSNPLANLSSAITRNNLLNPSVRVPADEALRIETTLRNSNKGFINHYKNAEIAQKKNFLLVVDHFEDVFKYPPNKEADVSIFIDNLLRVDYEADLAVYIIFSLRNEHLGDLFPFRRLQEYLNEFQYSIPRLRRADIEAIVKGTAKISGFSYGKDTIDYLHKNFGNDPSNIAHFQFFLYKAFSEYQDLRYSESNFNELGGFQKCFEHALESSYQQQTDLIKSIIEKFTKTIANIDDLSKNLKPKKFKEIVQLCESDGQTLRSAISFYNNNNHVFIDQIPPIYKYGDPPPNISIYNDDLVDIRYPHLIKTWRRFQDWVEKERESKEMYLRLINNSNRYETGLSDFLKPPELNIYQSWFESQKPSKTWAIQYHPNYQKAIDFLNKSIKAFEDKVKAKELAQKNKLAAIKKRLIIIAAVSFLVIVVVTFFYIGANKAQAEAEEEREKASLEKQKALEAKSIAEQEREKADEEREDAIEARKRADLEKEKALKAKEREEKAKSNLVKSLEQEKEAKRIAEQKQIEAERANKAAEAAKVEEELAKNMAQTRENLANIQNELFLLENELRVNQPNSALIRRTISSFNSYQTYCQILFGDLKPSKQLQKLLSQLDQKTEYYQNHPPTRSISKAALRAISVFNNTIAVGGDDGVIYLVNNNLIDKINLEKRIRSIAYSQSLNSLIVGTFDGFVYTINPTTKEIKLLVGPDGNPGPIRNIVKSSDDSFLLIADKNIYTFIKGKSQTYSFNPNGRFICGAWLPSIKKYLISSTDNLFIFSDGKLTPILQQEYNNNNYISAIAYSENKIGFGFKNGLIKIFDSNSFMRNPQLEQPVIEFIDHQSEITNLVFSPNGILYSSGFDKKIYAYNMNLSIEEIPGYIVSFEDGKNWIWDIQVNNQDEVLGVDESGFLYLWVNNPTLQIQKLENFLNTDF